jgi:hypothetical protein
MLSLLLRWNVLVGVKCSSAIERPMSLRLGEEIICGREYAPRTSGIAHYESTCPVFSSARAGSDVPSVAVPPTIQTQEAIS